MGGLRGAANIGLQAQVTVPGSLQHQQVRVVFLGQPPQPQSLRNRPIDR